MPTKGHHKIQPVIFLRSRLKIKILLFFLHSTEVNLSCCLCNFQANLLTLCKSGKSFEIFGNQLNCGKLSIAYVSKQGTFKQGTFSGGNAYYSGNAGENLRTYRLANQDFFCKKLVQGNVFSTCV